MRLMNIPIVDNQTVVRIWRECGENVRRAAARLGYTESNVRYRLKQMGLTLNGKSQPRVSDEELLAVYKPGQSSEITGHLVGYSSRSYVRRRLRAKGIPKCKPGPKRRKKAA
jgi:hypothetical protein